MILLILTVEFLLLGSCVERIGSGSGDSRLPVDFFLKFIDPNTGEDYFRDKEYDPSHFMQQYIYGDNSISQELPVPFSYQGEDLVLGPLQAAQMTGGLDEPGVLVSNGPFYATIKLIFSEDDIDTIHSIVTCGDNCNYEEKTLEMYYNGNLILDLDFSGKDSLLLEELLDNNRPEEYGEDTVVFVIEKFRDWFLSQDSPLKH